MDKKSSPNIKNQPKKRKKITLSYLENAGAYYLERFSASITSFRRVMERKIARSCHDHPEQDKDACLTMLDEITAKFVRLGYLNDEIYAKQLAGSLQTKGQSHRRIKQNMALKGLSEDLIGQSLPDMDEENEKAAALRLAKKRRLGCFATRPKENDLQKGLASLMRAGFDFSTAQWVMGLTIEDIEKF